MKKVFIIFASILMLFSLSAYAIPQQINFQGRLTSSDATPITGQKSVTFNLYSDPSGSTLVSSESMPVKPDKNGVFSVLLSFEASAFETGDRWLEVQVQGASAMTPIQKISAVPYAYRAITAESVVGWIGNYVLKTGDKMTGNLTIEGAGLKVSGTIETGGGIKFPDGKIQTKAVTQETGSSSVHSIGESYGGGKVFYVYDNGRHGLIAATADQSDGIRWYAGTYTTTEARADGVGAGKTNTVLIVASQGYGDGATYAARVCNEYSTTEGGTTYGNWYLPSKHELNLLYQQRGAVDIHFGSVYWSSTEFTMGSAYLQSFSTGNQSDYNKNDVDYVRAIRAF
jgi:hypothetical protein